MDENSQGKTNHPTDCHTAADVSLTNSSTKTATATANSSTQTGKAATAIQDEQRNAIVAAKREKKTKYKREYRARQPVQERRASEAAWKKKYRARKAAAAVQDAEHYKAVKESQASKAARQKRYRARKATESSAAAQPQPSTSRNDQTSIAVAKREKKTKYKREYRARQPVQGRRASEAAWKQKYRARKATESSAATQPQPSTSKNDQTSIAVAKREKKTKYKREYRARQPVQEKRALEAAWKQKYRARKAAAAVQDRRGKKRSANVHEDNTNATKRLVSDPAVPDDVDEQRPPTIPTSSLIENEPVTEQESFAIQYEDYLQHSSAHSYCKTRFLENNFGAVCYVCDRIWYDNDLKSAAECSRQILTSEYPDFKFGTDRVCNTCHASLKKNQIPTLSKSNGFTYPTRPAQLPELDLISERLISPRLPFMQIRRLRHGQGQYGMLGQIINVRVSVTNMVHHLPRDLDDDFCINVHIKRKKIHKTSYLMGVVTKRVIKSWLQYLVDTPLYKLYDVTVNSSFFCDEQEQLQPVVLDEYSEEIDIEESLIAQQQTLLWNEDRYLCLAPGEYNVPQSILFDEHCEELSFPSIYLGQFRTFKEGHNVTPFMMATSELRRADRRGVHPTHLLYMAMKIMRLRTRDSLTVAFKYIGKDTKLTRAQVESENFINGCIETNLAFLRSIPNSIYYWVQRKRDLFAMIRQLGKPTFFLTMSANEIGWPKLMKILYKLKNNGAEICDNELRDLHYNDKAKLINEDPVTCAIHFNKLVNTIITILQSKSISPFGNHYVTHFFKRIEFQHRGSPHAHILLWLNDAPTDTLGAEHSTAITIIDHLVSVSENNSSGHTKLQRHKHTFTCDKKNYNAATRICRFGAPFMPCPSTVILVPMPNTDSRRSAYGKIYKRMWKALEENDYADIDHFFSEHNINSIEFYLDVLRAGITRPRVFLKRQPSEKWINPFNPFILNILGSNMDMQFIIEEYSCAAYVVEYVNKTNTGISNLQRKIIQIMEEHPEFDIVEITRKLSIDLLNTVEVTSQEAAWYLLRHPMSQSSDVVIYISTTWPIERERVRKTNKQLEEENVDDESADIWKDNWFDKYQKRPEEHENLTLAQVVANYTVTKKEWKKRQSPRIIRYRNYDMTADTNEYKREMVTLHLPFRDEETDSTGNAIC